MVFIKVIKIANKNAACHSKPYTGTLSLRQSTDRTLIITQKIVYQGILGTIRGLQNCPFFIIFHFLLHSVRRDDDLRFVIIFCHRLVISTNAAPFDAASFNAASDALPKDALST